MKTILGLLLLALASCLPMDADSKSIQMAQSGSGSGTPVGAVASIFSLPPMVHPESILVRAERVLTQVGLNGNLERTLEVFLADGQGSFRLDIGGFSPYSTGPFFPPPALLVASYFDRQRYLVRFRDPHPGSPEEVHKNWDWETLAATHALAGVDCLQHQATSRHGFGQVVFRVDPSNDLLLGWEVSDGQGRLIRKLETQALDFNPDLSGVLWSQPLVSERDWQEGDEALLGVSPLQARYLPPGFEFQSERFLEASLVLPGVPDIHFRVASDGIHPLIIAQHQAQGLGGGPSGGTESAPIETARWCRYGGIQVVEGQISGRQAYLVSPLPSDELLAVFGSLLP